MAAASVRLAAPSLPRMLDTCTLAVFGAMNSTEAISLLLRPAAMTGTPSRSRLVSAAPAVLRVGPGQPAPALGPEDELGPLGERRSLPGDLQQLAGRGDRRGRGRAVAGGPGLHRPVG